MKYSKETVIISTCFVSNITCESVNAKVEIACNLEIAADKFSAVAVLFLSCNLSWTQVFLGFPVSISKC